MEKTKNENKFLSRLGLTILYILLVPVALFLYLLYALFFIMINLVTIPVVAEIQTIFFGNYSLEKLNNVEKVKKELQE